MILTSVKKGHLLTMIDLRDVNRIGIDVHRDTIQLYRKFLENHIYGFLPWCNALDSAVLYFCPWHTSLPHYHAGCCLALAMPNCVAMKIDVTAWDV